MMVKRYDPEIENRGYLADHVTMEEYRRGDYVRYSDYEELESRVAELEAAAKDVCGAYELGMGLTPAIAKLSKTLTASGEEKSGGSDEH